MNFKKSSAGTASGTPSPFASRTVSDLADPVSPRARRMTPHGFAFALASFALVSVALLVAGCNVSDPHEHDEGELITSIRLVLTPDAGGASDTVWFRDPDGPGGSAPTRHDTIRLISGRDYRVSLSLLNESNPLNTVDMTEEIRDEADDHQVFYTVAGSGLAITYADQDAKGLPIGLDAVFTTSPGAPGSLTVTLKHQPGLKSAHSTINTGETDVAVTFETFVTDITL